VNEVFIATPANVTLDMIGEVLARTWNLDRELTQPSVKLGPGEWAYVAEVDGETIEDPLFLSPDERAALRQRIGNYRIFTVRYASPMLGRDMARAIASSELGEKPMLLDYHDLFLGPREFLQRTAGE
jgi:hypothetical protein